MRESSMKTYDLFDEDEPDDIDDCSSGVGWDFCDRCKRGIKPLQTHDWDSKMCYLCEKCIEDIEKNNEKDVINNA